MAKQIDRLTVLQVQKAARPGYYPDGAGLYLQVASGGSKSWLLRYAVGGRQRWMGLGSARTFSLAEARERARGQRKKLADGIDPIEAKRAAHRASGLAAIAAVTFDAARDRYLEANAPSWKSAKHADQWLATLTTYASPVIGKTPVQEVNTSLVLKILQPIWAVKTETASRVRGRMERILDWAKVHGYRTGDNPAAWRGQLAQVLPRPTKVSQVEHHPALPWQEIAEFMQGLRAMPGSAALATRLIILTATRTSEALGARWSEIDLKSGIWTIPAARMKARKEHRVPISSATRLILEQAMFERDAEERRRQEEGTEEVKGGTEAHPDFVFLGRRGGSLSNMACLALLKRMGRPDLTVHGFRSTFRDWAAENTNFPREVCEMALAHAIPDATEAAYRRGDLFEKRNQLMSDWARYCDRRTLLNT